MNENGKELKILSVEDILAAPDIREQIVEVAEWGGSVRIRSFSKKRQQELRHQAEVPDRGGRRRIDNDKLEMMLFIHGVVEPIFMENHYAQLREKSAGAMDRVLKAVMDLSGLRDTAVTEAEATFQGESGETV